MARKKSDGPKYEIVVTARPWLTREQLKAVTEMFKNDVIATSGEDPSGDPVKQRAVVKQRRVEKQAANIPKRTPKPPAKRRT